MNVYIGDKIKELRTLKGVSQEKLAHYLNISFQSVSKWENGNTYPDITLLPEIARFFDVTVDELLQVEKIDQQKLYAEYEKKACTYYRNGDISSSLSVWQEAYHAMPNNLAVKEMLMSSYFDADKVKYQKEIIELGTELYDKTLHFTDEEKAAYYRGQAIEILSKTFAVNGDMISAKKWAGKASYLMHAQEFLFSEITHGNDLLTYFRFSNHWYFKNLFYMSCRIANDTELSNDGYDQELFKTLGKLYEVIYPDGDMEFEMLSMMCTIHRCIAEDETNGNKNEEVICEHLKKALWYAQKSVKVKNHKLTHPLFKGIEIDNAPLDDKQILRTLKDELLWDCFQPYQSTSWYAEIETKINNLL